MRTVLQAGAALVVMTSSALALADPDAATGDSESTPSETHVRSPAMMAIGTSMIVVGAGSSGFASFSLALASANHGGGGSGTALPGFEIYAAGSFMTLITGIALVAFGATQVKDNETWQTGLWITPGGIAGRF